MSRNTPALTGDQSDLVAMLDALMSDVDIQLSDARPDEVAHLRARLADLGVWTLAVPERLGGGGGDQALAAVAVARLARRWAALAWAAVQAHAAAELLEGHPGLLARVHAGDVAIAVTGGHRVDAAGEAPHVVVLGAEGARLYGPESLHYTAVRHTGLDGALTRIVRFDGDGTTLGGDVDGARVRLRLGAAAVAAGIADAAAEAALGYSAVRKQFGGALTALPAVRDALFDSSGAAAVQLRQVVQSAEAAPWQAAAVLESACETAIDAAARAVQSHGGYGYLTEYPVERLLRDAVSLRAACDTAATRRDGALDLAGSAKG
ncbi:acyl-CoA dehydrogenase family protein [Amycolatopsis endophytica]|uniref:Alkylation response protein AidB-like acyl-CoA dehydrogenase n=1 Tax=Amycolatopsis endophytica TaxID=860233 RepID=A0A853B9L5_9PSEU|nr:acyl-CoA dehydrogenase family protein [Amycolatopsis endophytica]NYI91116.1 alkylation response protein AidB-like acyl-CoA dehydrogenase [Amycolatopsis endophytica]